MESIKPGTYITICIQDTGEKVAILNAVLSEFKEVETVDSTSLVYEFKDQASNHASTTTYEMRTIKK